MPDSTLDTSDRRQSVQLLTERLRVILNRTPPLHPTLVEDVVEAVLETIGGGLSSTDTRLLVEIVELGRIIANARAEVAELNVSDITGHHLPTATDELDAIVEHTAQATHTILDCCESLDKFADGHHVASPQDLALIATRIYEACGFHDIVGQRITKVVRALKRVEAKLQKISQSVGHGGADATYDASSSPGMPNDNHLLNGPQMPSAALVQSDIDKLMADFD